MRKLKSSFLAISAISAALLTGTSLAQPMLEGYLCCNMRSDSNGWISDINYNESGKQVVPLGTPAKVTRYGKNRLTFDTPFSRKSYQIGNDYSRNLDMGSFAERYIVAEDPSKKFATFPPKIQNAIKTMKVMRGMTKEQVLMAIGYPIGNETPILEDSWRYWYWTFSPFTLHWDENGRIDRIETDPQTFSRIGIRDDATPSSPPAPLIRS
jgi:hypothetical protein